MWGNRSIAEIKPMDIQLWFNELAENGYSHETLIKIKNTMSPALDAAVEEDLISKNPLKSKLLVIGGNATRSHKAIARDRMCEIREGLKDISDDLTKCKSYDCQIIAL